MATLPKASTSVKDTAGAVATGLDVCCVFAPVNKNADITPRFFGNAADVYDQHGYSEGLEYAALHFQQTGKALMFVGLPIITAGAIASQVQTGNTGTSQVAVAVGTGGALTHHTGSLKVLGGGVVGTDQIVFELSLDGGRSTKKIRMGTALTYTLPYVNVVVSATTGGTLVAGDVVLTWHATQPRTDTASITLARVALAGQLKGFRSILLIGDLQNSTEATGLVTELNAYETANERFVYGRGAVRDRLPLPSASRIVAAGSGALSLTFAAAGFTITRAAGSWITDGFAIGDLVSVLGSVSNNVTNLAATAVSATVLTFAAGIVNEGPITTATVRGAPKLTFAATTITRSRGSFITEGFAIGDFVTPAGTASNNTTLGPLTAVSATVLTFAAGGVAETVSTTAATLTKTQTKAAWMALTDSAFSSVDSQFRIDLSAGRGRIASPFSGWNFRRAAAWFASLREYKHDLHIATWRKSDGPVGADLFDTAGNLAEWDDRVDGGAGSAARFTTLRTYGNGPNGAFVTLSLTRGAEGSLLSYTHNVSVVNLVCSTVQLNTENVIGRSLTLNDDGTATTDALNTIQTEINAALELAVLVNAKGEGPRASKAVWTPSADDILNIPEAILTGVVDLNLNGTVHSVTTAVRVRSGGQS